MAMIWLSTVLAKVPDDFRACRLAYYKQHPFSISMDQILYTLKPAAVAL